MAGQNASCRIALAVTTVFGSHLASAAAECTAPVVFYVAGFWPDFGVGCGVDLQGCGGGGKRWCLATTKWRKLETCPRWVQPADGRCAPVYGVQCEQPADRR